MTIDELELSTAKLNRTVWSNRGDFALASEDKCWTDSNDGRIFPYQLDELFAIIGEFDELIAELEKGK